MDVGYTPLDGAPVDSPQVEEAMRVYGTLNEQEREQVFLTMCRAVDRYRRTSDIDALVKLAESIEGMIRLSRQAGYREAMRDLPSEPPKPGEGVDLNEVIKRLRE